MNKTAIKNFAIYARNKLIEETTYKAGMYGVTADGIAEPLPQSTADMKIFDIGTKNYAEVSGTELYQREALVREIQSRAASSDYRTAFDSVIEEVSYTWFNRMIAIRFMEVNDYLPSGVRVLSSYDGAKSEPDIVTEPFDTELDFTAREQDFIMQCKDDNRLDELFRMLFIKQCNALHDILPELFEKTDDYTELLLTISFTDKDGVVRHLVDDISEGDFDVQKEGQIEIIGWLYQYYNTEPKDDTYKLMKKNVKITKDRIASVTQLFTPHWIVKYMVENSLGRLWVEGHPDKELKNSWKYYIDEAEQEEVVEQELREIKENYSNLSPEDIKFIDPCMGSGHILVSAFDVFMQIYERNGYTQRDAAKLIIEKNLYGLDIDKRAYQLSYFAVLMKGRQYNRRILKNSLEHNLFVVNSSGDMSAEAIEYIADGNEVIKNGLESISHDLKNAGEYGSLTNVASVDFELIYKRFEAIKEDIGLYTNVAVNKILPLVKQADALSQKYDVVCTNPPYLGGRKIKGDSQLANLLQNTYPDSKADLFSVFIERFISFSKFGGLFSFVTPESWMFTSSYEKLREKLLKNTSILVINHIGEGGFEVGYGTVSCIMRKAYVKEFIPQCISLNNESGDKENAFLQCRSRDYFFRNISQEKYNSIKGKNLAYWCSKRMIDIFLYSKCIGDYGKARQGMATSDNNRFLRLWYEVQNENIEFDFNEKTVSCKKWFPYNKGGGYRKWYGTAAHVINWENDGKEVKDYAKSLYGSYTRTIKNIDMFFKESVAWSYISTNNRFGARYQPEGFIFDVAGSSLFADKKYMGYFCSLLCSKIAIEFLKIINPTMNYQAGDISRIPVLYDRDKNNQIELISKENIFEAKLDWDAFETSWDFKRHPLI